MANRELQAGILTHEEYSRHSEQALRLLREESERLLGVKAARRRSPQRRSLPKATKTVAVSSREKGDLDGAIAAYGLQSA